MMRFIIALVITLIAGVILWFSLQFVMHSLRVSSTTPSEHRISTKASTMDGMPQYNLKNTPFLIVSPFKNTNESVDKNGWTMVATTSDKLLYFMTMVHIDKNESDFANRASQIGIENAYIEQKLFDTNAQGADNFIDTVSRAMYPKGIFGDRDYKVLSGPVFIQNGKMHGLIRLTEHSVIIDGTIKHFVYYQYEGIVEGYDTSAAFLIRFDNEQEYSRWKESYKKDFPVISKQILDIFQIKNE